MRKAIVTLLLLVLASVGGLQAQTIDCTQAFTRLEHAICSNPELEDLNAELANLSAQAVASRLISQQGIHAMQNLLALRCTSAEEVDACLIEQSSRAIAQLSTQPGAIVEIPASHVPNGLFINNLAALQLQFQRATEHHQTSGSEDELAQATLDLLDYYRQESVLQPAAVRHYEIAALEATVARGCGNLAKRREWQRVIQARGRSCDNALYVAKND